jgi:hypothetical protein
MNLQENVKILKSIAKKISNKLHCDRHGSCVHFAEIFVEEVNEQYPELLNDFDVIEGYVNAKFGNGIPQEHTWIRLNNGEIIDPTFSQFDKYDKNAQYSKKRTKVYSGQEYYDEGKEGSWFSERRKKFPSSVFKEGKRESIRNILREESNHSKLIVKLLNRLVVSRYEDICKIEVVHPSVTSDYSFYRVIVYFNQGTKKQSRTWEENILNEVWEYVHDIFGFSVALHSVRVPSCDSNKLNEERKFSPLINRRLPENEVERYFSEVKNRLINMLRSENESNMDKDEFKRFIITYTINFIMDNYYESFPEMTDFYEKLFDELYEYYNDEMDESYESINNNESLLENTSRTDKIKSMVDEFGVFNTIKAVGGYTKFKKIYDKNLTKDEKVILIRELVKEYGEDGDYIDVMEYDIFVDIDTNQTDSRDYTTEVIYVNKGGYFNFRQYPYDDELEEYDWEDYYNGSEYLFRLSESELEDIIRVIFDRLIYK